MATEKTTVKELIKYLKKYPKDSEVKLLIIDTHQDKEVGFIHFEYCFATNTKFPLIIVDIDQRETMDISEE